MTGYNAAVPSAAPTRSAVSEESAFRELMLRVRAGDAAAATELVRTYEPAIRRAVRVRLEDTRLQRLCDSMDICQSVLASFFLRAAAGQYDLEQPDQLFKLLVSMARNKLADEARRQAAACRGGGVAAGGLEGVDQAAPGGTPSEQLIGQELLEEFRKRLTDEERQLADQRALGREWTDIAAELGDSPEALRKRLTRAIDRVTRELGLEE
jgi:RNA polymerase sigma factor (sigma-70 family)